MNFLAHQHLPSKFMDMHGLQKCLLCVGVLKEMTTQISVSCDVTPWNLVHRKRTFWQNLLLHHHAFTLNMETLGYTHTLVPIYYIARSHVSDDNSLSGEHKFRHSFFKRQTTTWETTCLFKIEIGRYRYALQFLTTETRLICFSKWITNLWPRILWDVRTGELKLVSLQEQILGTRHPLPQLGFVEDFSSWIIIRVKKMRNVISIVPNRLRMIIWDWQFSISPLSFAPPSCTVWVSNAFTDFGNRRTLKIFVELP
jgi:hypothetical protein